MCLILCHPREWSRCPVCHESAFREVCIHWGMKCRRRSHIPQMDWKAMWVVDVVHCKAPAYEILDGFHVLLEIPSSYWSYQFQNQEPKIKKHGRILEVGVLSNMVLIPVAYFLDFVNWCGRGILLVARSMRTDSAAAVTSWAYLVLPKWDTASRESAVPPAATPLLMIAVVLPNLLPSQLPRSLNAVISTCIPARNTTNCSSPNACG